MGIPPAQYGVKQISHPSAPPICVEDRNSEIRRIVIRGLNGARYLTIGQGATSANVDSSSRPAPSNQQPYYPPISHPAGPGPALVRLTGLMAIFRLPRLQPAIYLRWLRCPDRPLIRSNS